VSDTASLNSQIFICIQSHSMHIQEQELTFQVNPLIWCFHCWQVKISVTLVFAPAVYHHQTPTLHLPGLAHVLEGSEFHCNSIEINFISTLTTIYYCIYYTVDKDMLQPSMLPIFQAIICKKHLQELKF